VSLQWLLYMWCCGAGAWLIAVLHLCLLAGSCSSTCSIAGSRAPAAQPRLLLADPGVCGNAGEGGFNRISCCGCSPCDLSPLWL
jgi:hypothetical protein